MKTTFLCILITTFLFGCAAAPDKLESMAIEMTAEEFGVAFAKADPALGERAEKYLDGIEKLKGAAYLDVLQVGLDYAFDQIKGDELMVARLKSKAKRLIGAMGLGGIQDITLPEGYDLKRIESAVKGFRSGLVMYRESG